MDEDDIELGCAQAEVMNENMRKFGTIDRPKIIDVPSNCRQRLMVEGKAYPRSSCAVCGQFSPRWKECDDVLKMEKTDEDS